MTPSARYEFYAPGRHTLGRDSDAKRHPLWRSSSKPGPLFVFEGELKAIAAHFLFDIQTLSACGYSFPHQAAVARIAAAARGVVLVVDDDDVAYHRARIDGIADPTVRALQLGAAILAVNPRQELKFVRATKTDGVKLDLDEVFGLAPARQAEVIAAQRDALLAARPVTALIQQTDVVTYLAALNGFGRDLYAGMQEMQRARLRGSSREVRLLRETLERLEAHRRDAITHAPAAASAILAVAGAR
jgi:hypothetical protein